MCGSNPPAHCGASGLSDRQLAAARFVARGRGSVEIAQRLHVNRHTVARWRRRPAFIAEVERLRSRITRAATAPLRAEIFDQITQTPPTRYNPPTAMPDPSANKEIVLAPQDAIIAFHLLYYLSGHRDEGTWQRTFWMGIRTEKCPLDLWVYQEILHSIRPQLIIETGTRHGGSALFLCNMLDLLGGEGEVVTVDIVRPPRGPNHPRLTYLTGSSTAPDMVAEVHRRAAGKQRVLVILDSDHSKQHVLEEMRAYHGLVSRGSYMIVEDTNVNGHPIWPEHGPGPMEAIDEFMTTNHDFIIDSRCEKFLLTFNPRGYLRRKD
jgi:cephalosporin hydroxylase